MEIASPGTMTPCCGGWRCSIMLWLFSIVDLRTGIASQPVSNLAAKASQPSFRTQRGLGCWVVRLTGGPFTGLRIKLRSNDEMIMRLWKFAVCGCGVVRRLVLFLFHSSSLFSLSCLLALLGVDVRTALPQRVWSFGCGSTRFTSGSGN